MSYSPQSRWITLMLGLALVVAVFVIDTLTAIGGAIAVLYVLALLLVAPSLGMRQLVVAAIACAALTVTSFLLVHSESWTVDATMRCAIALLAIAAATALLMRNKTNATALAEQAALLRSAQRLSQTGSVGFDIASGAISWSPEAARIFGVPVEGPSSLELFAERIHTENRQDVVAEVRASLADGRPLDLQYRLQMPDGTIKHVHMVTERSTDRSGRMIGIGALRDETAEREAEFALHRTQQELAHVGRLATLGELTASLAHEVNQPLAGVVANGEAALRWMQRDPPNLHEVNSAVSRMIADGRRASEIVGRVRALARRGATVEYQTVDINEVIEESALFLQRELAMHGVRLATDLAAGLPPARGDRVQLQQVLINLIVNAIQAMGEEGGRIGVRSAVEDDMVVVEVADSGPGIDAAVADRLFDAFVTTKATSMGMGLSICRTIMEAHGGTIATIPAASGAVFRMSVPALGKEG